jgi:cellobiose-specific phosphotransferase system component IIC
MTWEILAMVVKAVQQTDLDDKVADAVAKQLKEILPGEALEPYVAAFLHLIVDKLMPEI